MKLQKQLSVSIVLLILFIIFNTGVQARSQGNLNRFLVNSNSLKASLKITAEISTGDQLKDYAPIPVTVDVYNSGKDFKGQIALVISAYGSQGGEAKYYKNVSVPGRGGRKRFFLYIPDSRGMYVQEINVKAIQGNEEYGISVPVRTVRQTDYLVMILNRQRGGLSNITKKGAVSQNRSTFVNYPSPDKLPLNWKSFHDFDMILINDLPSLNLSHEVQEALLNYVRAGGRLVFSSNLDPNEFNNSAFKQYLPFQPMESRVLEGANGVFEQPIVTLMTGNVTGLVMLEEQGNPLLIEGSLGEGKISFITADLSKRPFTEDFQSDELWPLVIYDGPEKAGKTDVSNSLENLLKNLPELGAPGLGAIFWLLIFYGLLVGPANYYYLKEKEKLKFIYLTVPVIAIVFSFVIFLFGYVAKGTSIIQRNISVVYLKQGQSSGFADSYLSLFSPNKSDYDISIIDRQATGWEVMQSGGGWVGVINEDENLTFEDQKIEMWSVRLYRAQKVLDFSEPSNVDIAIQGQMFAGEINNGTGRAIDNCVIFHKGRLSKKFTLKPGSNRVNVDIEKANINSSGVLARDINRLLSWGMTVEEKKKDESLKLKNDLVAGVSRMVYDNSRNFNILGWNDDSISQVKLSKTGGKKFNLNLFYIR
ncbi:MAG: hypothetical protein ACLFQV_07480 [Vulcanimicrobiota bacterium]